MYYSFIMLKPDALERGLVEEIMDYLRRGGVEIERLGCTKAGEELLSRHYAQVFAELGPDFKRKMLDYFRDKFVLPMVVRGESPDLVADIRRIVGATNPAKADRGTIRGDLGCDSYEKCGRENRSCQNLIHASDSAENARIETALWFGGEVAARYF